jgi:hypothetical protein
MTYDEWRKKFRLDNGNDPSPRDAWKGALQSNKESLPPSHNSVRDAIAFAKQHSKASYPKNSYSAHIMGEFIDWLQTQQHP